MAKLRSQLSVVPMTLVSLVVAHNLAFVLADGPRYGDALARSGHGRAWETAVEVVLAAGFGLLAVAVWQLRRLGLLARALGAGAGPLEPGVRLQGRRLVWLWLTLTATTAVAFTIQENLEHLTAGAGLPGLTVLGSLDHPAALFAIVAVALAVAGVGTLIRWRRELLVARIAAVLESACRRPVGLPRPSFSDVVHRWATFGRGLEVRAPPVLGRI